jgi:hypothetical protein
LPYVCFDFIKVGEYTIVILDIKILI